MSTYRSLSLHRSTLIALVLLALALASRAALTPALHSVRVYLASESQARARGSSSDAGGQTASPNPSGGSDQEERMRQLLAQQYEQRFGVSDEAIRAALGLRGKVADFVGYNARSNQWLIAESKTSHLSDAYYQLKNTLEGLLVKYPGAQVELRIYVNGKTYEILTAGNELSGWRVVAGRQLGWFNQLNEWIDAEIAGIKIFLYSVP